MEGRYPQGADEDVGKEGGAASGGQQEALEHAVVIPAQHLHKLGQEERHLAACIPYQHPRGTGSTCLAFLQPPAWPLKATDPHQSACAKAPGGSLCNISRMLCKQIGGRLLILTGAMNNRQPLKGQWHHQYAVQAARQPPYDMHARVVIQMTAAFSAGQQR